MENQYDHNPYEQPLEEPKRPGFLTFLCVLTFIGSGFSLLTYLLIPMFAQTIIDLLHNSSYPESMIAIYEQTAATPIWQFYLLALFCATSIMGAVYMLKMKKIGFHIYVISQLVQMAIGQFVIGGNYQPKWSGLFFTALFIGLYAIYYKKFTHLEDDQQVVE